MKTPGERLRWARQKAGFPSARAAALEMGIRVSTYNSHERAGQLGARVFDAEDAKTYGHKFQVPPAWLLFGKDSVERRSSTEANNDDLPVFDDPNLNAAFLAGQFLLEWRALDQTLDKAIQKLLGCPSFTNAENLVSHLRFDQKTSIIQTTLRAHPEQVPELSNAEHALTDIEDIEKMRVFIAHGRFVGTKDQGVKLAPFNATRASPPRKMTWSRTDFQETSQRIQQHTKTILMCVNALIEALSERDIEQCERDVEQSRRSANATR